MSAAAGSSSPCAKATSRMCRNDTTAAIAAIGALRLTGADNVAQAIRHISHDAARTLNILDLA
ncbi:hypothetical protein [Nonomuraea turcica]|uniref:hypothetical protein n=1 Tax=Nonomuraea sp. G32 TaxID=3067274 RepID=UPI00273AD70E|nr:hypothetical protein [Nonomuraea sp. G32]MDP4509373.1 hypothetical protein [Nonomuraea sp. G32]